MVPPRIYLKINLARVKASPKQQNVVANHARGQLKRENMFSFSPIAPENLVSRDEFGLPILRQSTHSPQ